MDHMTYASENPLPLDVGDFELIETGSGMAGTVARMDSRFLPSVPRRSACDGPEEARVAGAIGIAIIICVIWMCLGATGILSAG